MPVWLSCWNIGTKLLSNTNHIKYDTKMSYIAVIHNKIDAHRYEASIFFAGKKANMKLSIEITNMITTCREDVIRFILTFYYVSLCKCCCFLKRLVTLQTDLISSRRCIQERIINIPFQDKNVALIMNTSL